MSNIKQEIPPKEESTPKEEAIDITKWVSGSLSSLMLMSILCLILLFSLFSANATINIVTSESSN
jgi:hypothetical protein